MPHHPDFGAEEPPPESIVKIIPNSYELAILFVALITLFGVAFLVSNIIPDGNSVDDSFSSLPPRSFDGNFTAEHIDLARNQGRILGEIQNLNLFSQCIVDTNNIVTQEVPIDDQGGFRRVSVITLVCPEIE